MAHLRVRLSTWRTTQGSRAVHPPGPFPYWTKFTKSGGHRVETAAPISRQVRGVRDGLTASSTNTRTGARFPGPKSHAGCLVGWPYVPRFKNRIACSRLAPSSSASAGISAALQTSTFHHFRRRNLCAYLLGLLAVSTIAIATPIVPFPHRLWSIRPLAA